MVDLTDETLQSSCSHACGYRDHDGLSATCIVCDAELTDMSVGEAIGPMADDVGLLRAHLEAAREEIARLRGAIEKKRERVIEAAAIATLAAYESSMSFGEVPIETTARWSVAAAHALADALYPLPSTEVLP